MTAEITVTARHWAHGWELILDEDNATQVRSLGNADQQVRDYLETIDPDTDHTQTRITLVIDNASIRHQIDDARRARQEAEAAEAEAAQRIRSVVSTLRQDNDYSLADTAALLGVSRARITQLEKKPTTATTGGKNYRSPDTGYVKNTGPTADHVKKNGPSIGRKSGTTKATQSQ